MARRISRRTLLSGAGALLVGAAVWQSTAPAHGQMPVGSPPTGQPLTELAPNHADFWPGRVQGVQGSDTLSLSGSRGPVTIKLAPGARVSHGVAGQIADARGVQVGEAIVAEG